MNVLAIRGNYGEHDYRYHEPDLPRERIRRKTRNGEGKKDLVRSVGHRGERI